MLKFLFSVLFSVGYMSLREVHSNSCVFKSLGILPLCVIMPPIGYILRFKLIYFILNFRVLFVFVFTVVKRYLSYDFLVLCHPWATSSFQEYIFKNIHSCFFPCTFMILFSTRLKFWSVWNYGRGGIHFIFLSKWLSSLFYWIIHIFPHRLEISPFIRSPDSQQEFLVAGQLVTMAESIYWQWH